jgi:hypothetical protein
MHAGFIPWWRNAHRAHHEGAGCGAFGGPGASPDEGGWHAHGFGHHGEEGGGSFGVRRPLRFLAYKLDLKEAQTAELAKVLET